MEVTELGMVTLVSPVQFPNAYSPIEVIELGITVFMQPKTSVLLAVAIRALQLLRESYLVFPLATVMLVKPLQPANADLPIEVTELGILTQVRPLQPENA